MAKLSIVTEKWGPWEWSAVKARGGPPDVLDHHYQNSKPRLPMTKTCRSCGPKYLEGQSLDTAGLSWVLVDIPRFQVPVLSVKEFETYHQEVGSLFFNVELHEKGECSYFSEQSRALFPKSSQKNKFLTVRAVQQWN